MKQESLVLRPDFPRQRTDGQGVTWKAARTWPVSLISLACGVLWGKVCVNSGGICVAVCPPSGLHETAVHQCCHQCTFHAPL